VAEAESDAILGRREIEEIRAGMRAGLRGPVLVQWVEQLLEDRDARDRALLAALGAIEGQMDAEGHLLDGCPGDPCRSVCEESRKAANGLRRLLGLRPIPPLLLMVARHQDVR
jgi:hypothetical protein